MRIRMWARTVATIVTVCLVVGLLVLPTQSSTPTRNRGYWIAGANAQVFQLGDAELLLASTRRAIRGQIEDMAAHPGGRGYWLLGRDGAVYPYGVARDLGQAAFREQDAAAMASTPTGDGYWIANQIGEVRAFGDAVAHGSVDRRALVRRIADMAVTPTGAGYWLVDANGQIFAFGDASAHGSLPRSGADASNEVVAMASTPTGAGYWIASAAGDVLAFGDAPALGSLAAGGRAQRWNEGDARRQKKIVDMTPTHTGLGYWLVDRDGAVFAFGDADSYGQLGPRDLRSGLVTAIVSTPFVNHDPVAGTDSVALDEDTGIDIDVLANDTDEDGDRLTADILTQPAHGAAARNPDGTLRYVPAPDYNGPDAFTYRVIDGLGGSADGTVTLTIRPVNDLPVAAPDVYATDEDIVLTVEAPGVLGNDADIDGDTLVVTVTAPPSHGSLTLLPGGGFTYAPVANYHGPDLFSYEISDGQGGTATSQVTLTVVSVPDAPIAGEDAFTTDEDTTLTVTAPGVLGNDSDGDGDAITAILVTATSHGALALDANGGFRYTPSANYHGPDEFTYRASDGSLESGETTVAIRVAPVNDPPTAVADSYTLDEDTVLVVAAPGVMVNDTDVDGDPLSVRIVLFPDHGDLVLASDGSLEYTPVPNYNGPDSFTYRLSDGAETVTTSVSLTIDPVADPPTATDDAYDAVVGTALSIAAPGVLANDFTESGTLTAVLVTGPASGTLTLNGDGSFTYTTTLTAAGSDSFTYMATDGSVDSAPATALISVSASSGGGGGSGTFGTFARPAFTVWDFDELNLHTGGATLTTRLGRVVSRYGTAWYIPNRGATGRDSFVVNGIRFEVDVISDIWGY